MDSTAIEIQNKKFKELGLDTGIANDAQVRCYYRGLGSVSESTPVLVLIHGYPQSSFMWRHLIPLLPTHAPLFVPDLPGYGASAPIPGNDKLSVGTTIIQALKTVVELSNSESFNIPVVLIGHDRGARVAHRLAVSSIEGVKILGACFIDIVSPNLTQWAASSNPKEICGYFHWPFLANVELATKMLTAYGGATWCKECILRWAGASSQGRSLLTSDDSLTVYSRFFSQPHTIEASNLDYLAGATTDVEAQKEDQEKGRKVSCPVLLVYGKEYIGKRFDMKGEWREWVEDGVEIGDCGLVGGIGHFGAEEAPEETARGILGWMAGFGVYV